MKKRYSYRAYPGVGQQRDLSRLFGCVRFIYNATIAAARADHTAGVRYRGGTEYQKLVLTAGKEDHPWLREVSGVPLIQAVRDADGAYRNFFSSISGKRAGRRMGAPRFKSRRDRRQSARFTSATSAGGLRVREIPGTKWAQLFLPKIGWVRFVLSRPLPSQPSSVTVIRHPDGTHELSFVVEVDPPVRPRVDRVAGVDLGLTDFAAIVYSDGTREKIPAPRHYRTSLRRLRRAQKALARKQRGSANRAKALARVARLHRQVADRRNDFTHKLSTRLARENQAVAVEDLSVSGLARTRLALSIHDAGWSAFRRQLEEKTQVYTVDRWMPTTRTCSACGVVSDPKPLSVRVWTCSDCGAHLDRDYNAAVNILAAGLAESLNACGPDVRLRLARADGDETGTRRTNCAA